MNCLTLNLSGNPKSTQTIYRYTCRGNYGNLYMTKTGKDLKEQYKWEMKALRPKITDKILEVEIGLYFGTKRKVDVDNFNKLILDAGSGIIWKDDSQIKKLTVEKFYDKKDPHIRLVVKELS